MTKAEVVTEISKRTGLDKGMILEIIDSYTRVVKSSLLDGEEVFFRGFGSFILTKRMKKIARNIKKGTSIVVPEHFRPTFKPAKPFLEAVKSKVKEVK
ncbi:MAG: integration host factor subunit beta [Bacteroidales bacterium]|jgi:DNA-binding protein HU-beta|nr:integration host factor subunit beta [Bacteroidales bacterium]